MRPISEPHTGNARKAEASAATPAEHKRITALSTVKRNEQCRVLTIAGGEGMRSKMYNLGVHETERVKVVQNQGFGPLVIDIGGTRLILGRKMAERLWVSRI
ncbi:MAG: FeoA family protein [bacterium]